MTTNEPTMPVDAIEAAATRLAALHGAACYSRTEWEWAISILEAAAPHMLTEANIEASRHERGGVIKGWQGPPKEVLVEAGEYALSKEASHKRAKDSRWWAILNR